MYPRTYSSEWDFKNVNTKEYTHGYHNYPASYQPSDKFGIWSPMNMASPKLKKR